MDATYADRKGQANGAVSPASRAEFVYLAVRSAIQEGRLRPGERVRETELAERLGVSRTPVRDALKRLESDRLLVFAPRRGLAVAQVDQQQMVELYALREVLEGTAARLAAQHASEAEIGVLRDLLARQRELGGDAAALVRHNHQFHQTVWEAARNRYLLNTLHALRDSLVLLGPTSYAAAGRPGTALAEHEQLVRAIAAREAEAADQAARRHIRSAIQIRLALALHQPGEPEPS